MIKNGTSGIVASFGAGFHTPNEAPSWATIALLAIFVWTAGSIAFLCATATDKTLMAFGINLPWPYITMASTLLRTLLLIAIFLTGAKACGITVRQSFGDARRFPAVVALIAGLLGILLVSYSTTAVFWASKDSGGILPAISKLVQLPIMSYHQRNPLFGWTQSGQNFSFALSVLFISPFIEELLGCGLIYLALKKKLPVAAAIVINSALFVLRHFGYDAFSPFFNGGSGFFISPPPTAIVWLLLRGLIITSAYEYGGSLAVPILLHYFWNITGFYFTWTLPK
jgi:membrane protease YdiL (CAAX protease family)